VYPSNPPSPHPCRTSAQRRRSSIAGGGQGPGDHAYKANLLDGVGDVGAGERQVLEGPGKAPELSWISNRRPGSGGDLGLRVHRRRDQLAVHHASALKDVKSELALSVEESIGLMLYGDPQKMVKRAEVIHANSRLRADMVCCRSVVLDVVSTMS
jgi:hypothetical protein